MLLAMILWVAAPAWADGHYIPESAVFEDVSGRMTFDQVRQQLFHPSNTFLSNGYTRSAFWLRLKIDPSMGRPAKSDDGNSPLFVRIQPAYLDDVSLYDPLEPNRGQRINGDRHPWADSEVPSVNFIFTIPRGTQPRDVWIRVRTTSTHMVRAQVLDKSSLAITEKYQDTGVGIYVGLLLVLVLWPLLIWASDRDYFSGMFVAKQAVILLHALAIMGYWRMFLSQTLTPEQIDFSCNLIILLFGFTSVIFHFLYFEQFQMKRWVKILAVVVALAYPVCLGFLLSGDTLSAVRINMACLTSLSVSFLIVPVFGIPWKSLQAPIITFRTMMAIHVVIFIIAWINILPALGVLTTLEIAPYVGQAYGAVSGLIFFLFLKHRNRLIREQKFIELALAEANFLAEQNKRQEQSKFLYMLTHEIKTALSVIRIAFGNDDQYKKYKAHVSDAITDISDVIDRTLIVDKFDSAQIEVRVEALDLPDFLKEQALIGGVIVDAPEVFTIDSDPNLLRRVVTNLIDNAKKYGDPSYPVRVSLTAELINDVPHARIAVENRVGEVGFPDSQRVFEKYYRAPHAHSRTGSGLGLYLVKQLVESLGGKVGYRALPDSVVFLLTLPVHWTSDTRRHLKDRVE